MKFSKVSFLIGAATGLCLAAIAAFFLVQKERLKANAFYLFAFDARLDVVQQSHHGPDSLKRFSDEVENYVVPNMIVSIDSWMPIDEDLLQKYYLIREIYKDSKNPLRKDASDIIEKRLKQRDK